MAQSSDVPELPNRAVALLGALLALVPLSIDMYVPAMGAMAASLNAPLTTLQTGIGLFVCGLAVGQLLVGAWVDIHGPVRALHFGGALYAASSACGALITDPSWLLPVRAMQGFGAGALTIFARTTLTLAGTKSADARTARDFARASTIMGLTPIIAPMAGAALVMWLGWRAVFALMVVSAAALWLFAVRAGLCRAGLLGGRAARGDIASIVHRYSSVLLDQGFILWATANAAMTGALFVFISGVVPFLARDNEFTASQVGVVFALISFGFVAGSKLAARLVLRLRSDRLMLAATSGCIGVCLIGSFCTANGLVCAAIVVVCLFAYYFCYGMVVPLFQASALRSQPRRVGTAASLLGSLNFGFGAAASLLVGIFALGTTAECFAFALVLSVLSAASIGSAVLRQRYRERV